MSEMTLERAIGVLNERRHHGLKWSLWCSTCQTMASVLGEAEDRRDYLLHPDDAIALAERMERQSEDVTQRLLAYAKGIMHAQDAAKFRQPSPAPAPPQQGAAVVEGLAESIEEAKAAVHGLLKDSNEIERVLAAARIRELEAKFAAESRPPGRGEAADAE